MYLGDKIANFNRAAQIPPELGESSNNCFILVDTESIPETPGMRKEFTLDGMPVQYMDQLIDLQGMSPNRIGQV